MEFFVCAPHEIDRAWREGAHTLSEACKHASREITADQLKMLLAENRRTLVGIREGGEVIGWSAVQVQQLPNIRVLYVYAMAGRGICTKDGFALLTQYAQANGCSSVRGAVRPEMMRMMKQRFGAAPLYEVFEVDLMPAKEEPSEGDRFLRDNAAFIAEMARKAA